MSIALKLTILGLGLGFVIIVTLLLVLRRINERHTLIWLLGALAILILSIMPNILEFLARILHVDYPPALLFLLAILIILIILLYQSIQVSLLQERCRELAQFLAIMRSREDSAGEWEKERGVKVVDKQ